MYNLLFNFLKFNYVNDILDLKCFKICELGCCKNQNNLFKVKIIMLKVYLSFILLFIFVLVNVYLKEHKT